MNKLQATLPAILVGIALVIGAGYATAWTGPTAPAPGNNVPPPINVSAIDQTKVGAFETRTSLIAGALGPEVSLRTKAGKAALGTIEEINSNLTLLVGNKGIDGRIGALEYCDQDGLNCFDFTDVQQPTNTTCSGTPFLNTVGLNKGYYNIKLNQPNWKCLDASGVGCVIKQTIVDESKPGKPVVRVRLHDYYQQPISGPDIWRSTFKTTSIYKNGDTKQNNIIAPWNSIGILDDKKTVNYTYSEDEEDEWSAYDLSTRYSTIFYMCSYNEDVPVEEDED